MAIGMRVKVFHLTRLFLGAVFLWACYEKILHPQAFAETVYNYQLLPAAAVNITALVLPWLELLLGVCLITGLWLPGAVVTSVGVLSIFMAALVYNQIRGLDISCGCFSTDGSAGPAGVTSVVRDFLFWVAALYLAGCVLFKPEEKREIV